MTGLAPKFWQTSTSRNVIIDGHYHNPSIDIENWKTDHRIGSRSAFWVLEVVVAWGVNGTMHPKANKREHFTLRVHGGLKYIFLKKSTFCKKFNWATIPKDKFSVKSTSREKSNIFSLFNPLWWSFRLYQSSSKHPGGPWSRLGSVKNWLLPTGKDYKSST